MASTYSFLDTVATIIGPGGAVNLGSGSGAAEEGITVTMEGDKDTLTIGADGTPMHTLNASRGGEVVVRMLKTAPANAQLSLMYHAQTISSALHGTSTITIRDISRGDVVTCQQVAFRRYPANTYSKGASTIEWAFTAGTIDTLFGSGTPQVLNA